MQKYCTSCGAPTDSSEFKGVSDEYCKYCTDDKGNLFPREQILQGIAHWLKQWQSVSDEVAIKRAGHWMKAMPEWAEE